MQRKIKKLKKRLNPYWRPVKKAWDKFYSIVWLRNSIFFVLASIPVLVNVWHFAITNQHNIFIGEDWDEFAQMYEAARITILHYHQFPWWNPWTVGGEPLFGNPQFGLFSLQMPLVLIFGTVVGLHFSLLVYFFLGFWGMYRLLKRIGTNFPLRLLLSYIWTFSAFPSLHLSGGHYTFAIYLLTPWAVLSLLNLRKKWGWLWFSLTMSLIFNTAIHYMSIQLAIMIAILAVYELGKRFFEGKLGVLEMFMPYIKAGLLFAVLILPKAIYTLQFSHEFPHIDSLDDYSLPVSFFMVVLTSRHAVNPLIYFNANWSWMEYGDYYGIISLALTFYMALKVLLAKTFRARNVLLLAGMFLAFLLFMGRWSKFAPYNILLHLPIFNQMRVSSRYIAWFVFGAIILLAQLPKRKIIYLLLLVSIVDVYSANQRIIDYAQQTYVPPKAPTHSFQQYAYFETHGVADVMNLESNRLLRATQSNYGEVYGYEPALEIGEYYVPLTIRCGINQGCPFVMSHNATVTSWTPNKIVMHRTASGPVELSMNPGRVWSVNGQDVFKNYRILEMHDRFVINNPSKTITVAFSPRL
jgi:hypothetical protein